MISSKVVVVSKYALIPDYGISSKVYQTAKHFSDFLDTTLITSNSNHLSTFPDSKEVFNSLRIGKLGILWISTVNYKKSKSFKRILSWFDFELKIRRIKFDKDNPPKIILISSLSLLTIIWALKLKKKFGTRVVFEIRDIYPLTLTSELGLSKFHPMVLFLAFIEKKGYRESDLIVGTMPLLYQHVEKVIGYRKDVFYSPIGLNSYHDFNRPKTKIDFGISYNVSTPTIIGYSGSIGESNFLESFIRVIQKLRNNPNFYFVIVGGGDYLNLFKKELVDCSNVKFVGRVNPEMVQDYLSSFDCIYFSAKPSKVWQYGQSLNKMLDYLISGKPIIAAYDGYPNMLNEFEGNLIIPPDDDLALIDALATVRSYDSKTKSSISKLGPTYIKNNYLYDVINRDYFNKISKLLD